jgi:hypothetical protein
MLGSVLEISHGAVVQRANVWSHSQAPSISSASGLATVVVVAAAFLPDEPHAAAMVANAGSTATDANPTAARLRTRRRVNSGSS